MATKPRLTSLNGVRRYLAATVQRLENDEINETRARCIAYLAQVMAQILKDSALEQRIIELEKVMEAKKR